MQGARALYGDLFLSLSLSFLSVCIVFVIEGTRHSNARSRVMRGGDLYLRDTIVSDCSGHRDGGTDPAVHLVVGHYWC